MFDVSLIAHSSGHLSLVWARGSFRLPPRIKAMSNLSSTSLSSSEDSICGIWGGLARLSTRES
jgi:hypothetical protein